MKDRTIIVVSCLLIVVLMFAEYMLANSRMDTCIKATKTPNYEVISGNVYCELPNRTWIKLGE